MRVVVRTSRRCPTLSKALERASRGEPGWADNYDWMLLEMYDQAVREKSGGSCNDCYRQEPIPNWGFICADGRERLASRLCRAIKPQFGIGSCR